jgi:hypothetical protein
MIRNCIGCPSSGTLQLFVERNQGHLLFTIGKFHGGIILSHSIHVREDDVGMVHLIDSIHIEQGEDVDTLPSMPCLGHGLYAPSIQDFLHQTMSSFKRLGQWLSVSLTGDELKSTKSSYTVGGEDFNAPLLPNVH